MPALEIMDLRHRAALFVPTGRDGYGKVIVGAVPVEIRCRWINKQAERMDAQGNTIAVDAQAIVAQDIPVDSILWLAAGVIGDQNDDAPTQFAALTAVTGLMQVKSFDSTPDLKVRGRNVRRELGMIRFTDTLPTS